MKKLLLLFMVGCFAIAVLSSCKTADCPAYTKADTQATEQKA